jgi:hypothetical protein
MLICSSTSWLACQKKRYGEIVVPRRATRMPMYAGLREMVGTSDPSRTLTRSGRAKRAAPMYASRARDSHLKTLSIRR